MPRHRRNANQKYHDRVAGKYEQIYSDVYWQWHDALTWDHIKRFLPANLATAVLDLGCGSGKWGRKLLKSGYAVTFVDLSAKMVDEARKHVLEAGTESRADFLQADLMDLSALPADHFGFAVALGEPLGSTDEPLKAYIVAFTRKVPILTDEFIKVVYADAKPLHIPSLYLEQMKRCIYGFISEFNTQAPFFDLVIQNGCQVLLVDIYRIRTDYLIEEENVNSTERMQLKYDLAKAAKITFLCPRQFTNICKQVTGMSFINYLNRVRVEKAKELIRDTQMPITQIALIVGFENLSSFYRVFKKVYDRSPLDFRNGASA